MKKYRIKVDHTKDGIPYFVPQKRWFFIFWFHIDFWDGSEYSPPTCWSEEAAHAKIIADKKKAKRKPYYYYYD